MMGPFKNLPVRVLGGGLMKTLMRDIEYPGKGLLPSALLFLIRSMQN
jgi:hypothetical protein